MPGLLHVASVGKEDPAVCGHDELAIGAAEPGEVAHVGLARDQESFGLHPRERFGYPASPQRMVHDRDDIDRPDGAVQAEEREGGAPGLPDRGTPL